MSTIKIQEGFIVMAKPSFAPVSVIGSEFVAQDKFDIIIERNSSGNLLISDIDHKILLKVKPCDATCHRQRVLLDANDKPILVIREKYLTAHDRWNVFRGDGKSESNKIFTTKKHHLIQFKTSVDVFLANKASNEDVSDFNIKGSWKKRNCTINMGDTSATIAQMHKLQSKEKLKFVNDKFIVKIHPNVDYAFVVTLIAIVEVMETPAKQKDASGVVGVIDMIGVVASQ